MRSSPIAEQAWEGTFAQSSPVGDVRRFVVKLSLFLLPFLLVLGFPVAVLFGAGELTPIERVIARQRDSARGLLFGLAYSNPVEYYKLQAVLAREPDVIALGTSRVMMFRSRFFRDDVSFYNAGGTVREVGDFVEVLEHIPESKTPRVLIIGLDQYFFNEEYHRWDAGDLQQSLVDKVDSLGTITSSWRQLYQDYGAGKFSLSNLIRRNQDYGSIGLIALAAQGGFRNDGSRSYGALTGYLNPATKDYQFRDTFQRIDKGCCWFNFARHLYPPAVSELERFLRVCQSRGIYVVGFLPPFAHAVYAKLLSMPDQYAYLHDIAPAVKPLFDSYGYAFHDFSDVAALGASDDEMQDGFHALEKAYLRLFLAMIEDDPTLRSYAADETTLRTRLDNAENDYYVFGMNEY